MIKTLLVTLLVLLTGPAQAAETFASAEEMCPDVATGLVVEARKAVDLVDMSSFRQDLKAQDYDLLVDVREPSEFAKGHLPGAINIPRGLIEFMIWPQAGLPEKSEQEVKQAKIYLYCNSGGRASLSGKSLGELGFTQVKVVDMKLEDWTGAGFSIEKNE